MKRIIKFEDFDSNDYIDTEWTPEQPVTISNVYQYGEYTGDQGDRMGFLEFETQVGWRKGWYIGCSDRLCLTFEDGSTAEFKDMQYDVETEADKEREINRVINEITHVLFDDDYIEEPESDMPDIF